MGLALLFGFAFAAGGIFYLLGAFVLLFFAIKKKKVFMYILSFVSFVISIPISAIGCYVVYDILRYAGLF